MFTSFSKYLCLSCIARPIVRAYSPFCGTACARHYGKSSAEDAKAKYWTWRRANHLDTYMADKLMLGLHWKDKNRPSTDERKPLVPLQPDELE